MPTVPRRSQQRVATQALPGVRVPTDVPSATLGVVGSVGPDLSGVQRQLGAFYEREREHADQVVLLDADNQLAKLETDLRVQASARRGKDVLTVTPDTDDAWRKGTSEIEKTLTNDRQLEAFRNRVASRGSGLYEFTERHTAAEYRRYEDETAETALAFRRNGAIANYQDTEIVAQHALEARAIVRDMGKRNGWSDEAVEARVLGELSQIHTGVIARMITAGDDRAAAAYYAKAKSQITGDHQERIDGALEQASTLGEAQRRADAIIKTKGITRTDAFEQARAIDDPQVRKATEQQLDIEFARRERAEREAHDDLLNRAAEYAERGAEPPATIMSQLNAGERSSLRALRRSVVRGDMIETDQSTYYELQRMAIDPAQRTKFAQLNLNAYRAKLSNSDFQEMVRLQNSVIKKGDEAVRGILTDRNIVDQTIAPLFPDAGRSTGKGREQETAMSEFRREIDEDLRAEKRRTGKDELAPEVVQKISDAAVLRRTFQGGKDTTRVPTDEIPKDERDAIVRLLRANGLTVSTDKVERLFAATLMKNRALFERIAREP